MSKRAIAITLCFCLCTAAALVAPDDSMPVISTKNGTLSITSVGDVVFQLPSSASGTFSTSVMKISEAIDSNTASIAAVSTALQGTATGAASLSSAIAGLVANTVPSLSAATASVGAAANSTSTFLSTTLSLATASLAVVASRALDLYSITSTLSSALAAAQSYSQTLSTALGSSGVSISAAVAYTNDVSTNVATRAAVDVTLSSSITALAQTLTAQVAQANITLAILLAGQAALADSAAVQATRLAGTSTALAALGVSTTATLATVAANLSSLSSGALAQQARVDALSVGVTAQIASTSTATATLSANVYSKTAIDTQLSNAVATLSAATVAQVSTLNAATSTALAARFLSANFLATLQSGSFSMNNNAPVPSALGISGCVLWLDAMNYWSVPSNSMSAWLDISQSATSPRTFNWVTSNGASILSRGAFHFSGNGFFTSASPCNGANFLVYGRADRTLAFWARASPASMYLKHVFHYGFDTFNAAFGAAHWTNALGGAVNVTGIGSHQWGFLTVLNLWDYNEVAFMVMTLEGGQYFISKNGAPKVAMSPQPSTVPDTQYTANANFCNVGARITSPASEVFTGAISSVYSYSRALTNTEINRLYTATLRYF